MSAEAPASAVNGSSYKSPAAILEEQHSREAHQATVEDAVDEEDLQHPPPSQPGETKVHNDESASQPIPTPQKSPVFDVRSEELFPALGGPKSRASPSVPVAWGSKKPSDIVTPSNDTPSTKGAQSGASTPLTGTASPLPGSIQDGPKIMSLPGKHVEQIRFAPSEMLKSNQLKKPLRDILRDTSKRSKATVDVHNGPAGMVIFEGKGSVAAVRQALKEVAQQVGSKQAARIPVPVAARASIIGRGGSVIQGIHERTGARINVPRVDPNIHQDEDDDNTIDVLVEGDAVTAELARQEIEAIIKKRSANINLRLKTVPPELFPFLSGSRNANLSDLEERTQTHIHIPVYKTWSRRPPPPESAGPIQFVPDPDQAIHISGERAAAQEVRAELERRAAELATQITLRQLALNRGQHQFILGDAEDALHDFLAETGCSLVLPPEEDDTEFLTITGPPDQIDAGVNHAMDLATSMRMASVDLSRQHPNASHAHARALTAYLRDREIIKDLERQHDAHIVIPSAADGPVTWEVYSRDGKNTVLARSDIVNIARAHPPSKLTSLPIDPCFHSHLQSRTAPQLKKNFGVHLLVPGPLTNDRIVLVYEGQETPHYEAIRRVPSPDSISAYEKELADARNYILSVIGDPSDVVIETLAVPLKYHDKLRKFVIREKQSKGEDYIPVTVSSKGGQVILRGKSANVKDLLSKIVAFIAQQEQDDLERGYTTSCDFLQKFANILIGRKGENINKLRDEFDVDIKVDNGKVEIKGPKAKAEAAKGRIISLGKKLEDEATYVFKVPPQYHRDLIGQKGSQVNRLQDRYNVRVQFPRAPIVGDDHSVADSASEITGRHRPAQAPDEIVVRGPKRGADNARDEILSLYQWIVDHSHTGTISVAAAQIPALIGQRGREMDKLRADTEAQIDVPNTSEGIDRVDISIKGTKKQVEEARKALAARVKEFDSNVTKSINVDNKHHKALIGTAGSNIRKIIVDAGGPDDGSANRIVRFPRADSNDTTVRLEGNAQIVDNIITAINKFVKEREDQVTAHLDVPPNQHRFLIGRMGDTRRAIEREFNVSLDVPKQGSGRPDIKVRGASAAVEAAKARIVELAKEQAGETVEVPEHLHHAVADNGAFFRRLRNDYSVTVDHAGHKIPPKLVANTDTREPANGTGDTGALPLITDDLGTTTASHSWKVVQAAPTSIDAAVTTIPWVLSGKPEGVARAKAALAKAISTASRQSAIGYLILPDPRTYRFVVGPGGSRINAIRKETGCRIQVPRDQARSEAIEVRGTTEGVERARDLILDAVAGGR